MSYSDKIDEILRWAKYRPKFDASTIEGIKDFIDENGEDNLTEKQMDAINNVYHNFHIDTWDEEKALSNWKKKQDKTTSKKTKVSKNK